MKLKALIVLLALAAPAAAQQPGTPGVAAKPLAERSDVVSWKILAQVELVKTRDRFVPQFSSNVAALDNKEVKIQGFMMPLEMGDQQKHFVLSATPSTCAFCLPGGPESMVEIRTRKPVKYTFEPIVVTGRLAVLRDDPTGVFYRISDAVQAN